MTKGAWDSAAAATRTRNPGSMSRILPAAARVDGMIAREKPGACFLLGSFFAESLLLAEAGNQAGAVQVAGTAMSHQLPFLVAACDHVLIGEEFFAASAYLTGDAQLSWAEYHALSQRLARLLLGLGLERGERVAVLLPDGPGIHIAYLGIEKAGLVTVGIGARAGFRELEHALRLTGASGLISRAEHQGRSLSEFVAGLGEQGLAIRHHLVVEGELAEGQPLLVNGSGVEEAPAGEEIDARLRSRRLAPDDLFLLNFTSGTTGVPKCVKHDQKRWMSFHEFAVEAGI